MKKKLALLLAMLLIFTIGCGKNEEPDTSAQENVQTEFRLEGAGLSYTIPDSWVNAENVNLFPSSYIKENGEIFAKVQYSYAPDAHLAELDNPESETPVELLMTPLVELLVVKSEHLQSEEVQNELSLYESAEELPTRGEFHFFFLTDHVIGIAHFDKDAQETFEELEFDLPKLKDSIETFEPNPQASDKPAENSGQYLNFMSNTLEGDPINSTIFYEYDMTVVNFWASYCLEDDINELDELQEYYEALQKKHPNVNFVQVVIDTPAEDAEELVLDEYYDEDVTFTGIMPDENLARWIVNNLNGLPTTVFVNNQGIVRDFKIEGMQDASYYMEVTETMLDAITE